jgi:hypothetical protein
MRIIKIDRSSIKKNENAGSTTTKVAAHWTYEVELKSLPPSELIAEKGAFIKRISYRDMEHGVDTPMIDSCTVVINDPKLIEEFAKLPDAIIKQENNYVDFKHSPIPKYSFDYENSEIECDSCGAKVKREDIISDVAGDWYYEFSYEECPHCGEIDTFEYEFEEFDESMIKQK